MFQSLLKNCQITWASANVTSSTSRGTPLVDMSGHESCLFLLLGSTLSGSSKVTAVIQGATANSTATLYTVNSTPLSSSTAFGASASRNYKVLAVDCVRSTPYQYMRMRVDGSTGTGGQDRFLVMRYNPRKGGTTQASTTVGPCAVLATMTTY